MKIVINRCYGGFGLSAEAIKMYLKKKGKECYFYIKTKYKHTHGFDEYKKVTDVSDSIFYSVVTEDLGKTTETLAKIDGIYFSEYEIERTDKDLISVVEELGVEKASGKHASLEVVEIPDDIQYEIEEYDGIESIHEVHRRWP